MSCSAAIDLMPFTDQAPVMNGSNLAQCVISCQFHSGPPCLGSPVCACAPTQPHRVFDILSRHSRVMAGPSWGRSNCIGSYFTLIYLVFYLTAKGQLVALLACIPPSQCPGVSFNVMIQADMPTPYYGDATYLTCSFQLDCRCPWCL